MLTVQVVSIYVNCSSSKYMLTVQVVSIFSKYIENMKIKNFAYFKF